MSFLRGLINKDNKDEPEKKAAETVEKEEAGKVDPNAPRQNPLAGNEGAAAIQQRKNRVPLDEQKRYFESQKSKGIRSGAQDSGLVNKAFQSLNAEAATTLQKSLSEQGYINEEAVIDELAKSFGMERVSLANVKVTKELLDQIPKKTAKEYRVFPIEFDDYSVKVAISDPSNIQITDDLYRIIKKEIVPVIASSDDIERYFRRYYEGEEIKNLYEGMTTEMNQKELDAMTDQELSIGLETEDAPPVVKFVDLIFKQAVHERASDIHIEPTRNGLTIRFRVDGVLHEVPSPQKKWQAAILSRLKVLSGMDLAEKRVPQDGRIKLSLPDRKLDLRVSCLPSIHGETIVMRILDQSSVLLGLEDVGFLPDNISLFNSLIRRPTGVILMTGPTGSGKTTTLYSALSTLNSPEVKIVTIENPVEYMIEGINQVQVNEEVGLDFSTGLRSVLRQSPDVILVGEMRDQETAEIGIRAALTGHLVFSTLHTNDAPSAPGRLIDMGVKPFLVASSLQAVVAQRLLRRLCGACKKLITPKHDDLMEIGASEEELNNKHLMKIYGPVGCDRCNGQGYRGRTAIHEIMVVDTRIRQMIIAGESSFRLKKAAIRNGMRSLRMDGWQKVKLGQTSISEVLRITQPD